MFYKEILQRRAVKKIDNERVVKFFSLPDVRSAAIIFDINEENIIDTIKSLIEIVDKKGVKFSAVAVNFSKFPYPTEFLDHRIFVLNRFDVNHIGLPKYSKIEEFVNYNFNLFIDFSPEYNFTFDYITRSSRASFRVGRCNYQNSPYDLSLENTQDNSSRNFLNSIIHYLTSIRSA
ncbi:MAG: hypothetical protein Q8R90_02355 [Bacteroidales bacterium]|jgi:hypothetical protein|nr:hypothetical protein [Bacteroidales bacterium]